MNKKFNLYNLSNSQKRVYYTQKIYDYSSMFHIGGYMLIHGEVDIETLSKAIIHLIISNDSFAIRIKDSREGVVQYFEEDNHHTVDFVDFSVYKEPYTEMEKWIDITSKSLFQMYNSKLYYFSTFKLSKNEFGFLIKLHHLIADGWSMQLITEQIVKKYENIVQHIDEVIGDKAYSYKNYLEDEEAYLKSSSFQKSRTYWKNLFYGYLSPFKIQNTVVGARNSYKLSELDSKQIQSFCDSRRVSLNTLFMAAYIVYLYKSTGRTDIVVGSPVLGRSNRRQRTAIGMFVSSMPFRYQLNSENKLSELLKGVDKVLKESFKHQRYPLNILINEINDTVNNSRKLYDACINYYATKMPNKIYNMKAECYEFYNGEQEYNFQLIIKDGFENNILQIDIDYNTMEYTNKQINIVYNTIIRIIKKLILGLDVKIKDLSLSTEEELNYLIYKLNDTDICYDEDKTVVELFKRQVEIRPDEIALICKSEKKTYLELDKMSDSLAFYLKKKGIKEGSVVAIMSSHSIDAIAGIIAILKIKSVFLPIDPGCPKKRLEYMIQDSNVSCILVDKQERISCLPKEIDYVVMNCFSYNLLNQYEYRDNVQAGEIAYIIYTSGTTGKPKGVMAYHRGLTNYVQWAIKFYQITEKDYFAFFTSIAFDLTLTSIFTPLLSGGKITIYEEADKDKFVLYRILEDGITTIMKLTPAHLNLIKELDNSNSSMKKIIVGGEELKTYVARKVYDSFRKDVSIYNEYGPTETVVGCIIHKYDTEKDLEQTVPIGLPIDNTQIYLLDEHLKPVMKGANGEIYISGVGVAKGYNKQTELTKEKFLDNPFNKGTCMYRSGDIARYNEEDELVFVTRADAQIKINGYRIEISEIEQAILEISVINDCVVTVKEINKESKKLIAYIVKKQEIENNVIKNELIKKLPHYMIPDVIVELKKIPLTSNNKVDINQLPDVTKEFISENHIILPENETEKILYEAICRILSLNKVSMDDSFYGLGGDSIKAIQLATFLYDKGYYLQVKDIFTSPVLKYLSHKLVKMKCEVDNEESPVGQIEYLPIISWFFEQNFPYPELYTQSMLYKIPVGLDKVKVTKILLSLIKHHDSLRINYDTEVGSLYYKNNNEIFHVFEYDLSKLYGTKLQQRKLKIAEELRSQLEFNKGYLVRACVFNMGAKKELLLILHHMIVDGVSWRIIQNDLNKLIIDSLQSDNIDTVLLSRKTNSLQQWAYAVNHRLKKSIMKEIEYWDERIQIDFDFPKDKNIDDVQSISKETVKFTEEETAALLGVANKTYHTAPRDLMIAALIMSIKKYTHKEDIIIELEGHGREEIVDCNINITNTIGWFTSIFPFYCSIPSNDLSDNIKKIKDNLALIPNNGVGFGILKYNLKMLQESKKKYIRFNYLGEADELSLEQTKFISIAEIQFEDAAKLKNGLTSIFDINCFVKNRCFELSITYSKSDFDERTIKKFLEIYFITLSEIINFCIKQDNFYYTVSDFNGANLIQDDIEELFGD